MNLQMLSNERRGTVSFIADFDFICMASVLFGDNKTETIHDFYTNGISDFTERKYTIG